MSVNINRYAENNEILNQISKIHESWDLTLRVNNKTTKIISATRNIPFSIISRNVEATPMDTQFCTDENQYFPITSNLIEYHSAGCEINVFINNIFAFAVSPHVLGSILQTRLPPPATTKSAPPLLRCSVDCTEFAKTRFDVATQTGFP